MRYAEEQWVTDTLLDMQQHNISYPRDWHRLYSVPSTLLKQSQFFHDASTFIRTAYGFGPLLGCVMAVSSIDSC